MARPSVVQDIAAWASLVSKAERHNAFQMKLAGDRRVMRWKRVKRVVAPVAPKEPA